MLSKGEHQSVPLSVLLKREHAQEKIERPDISHGQANQIKKGEDFTFLKPECQRVLGDEVTNFSVFGVRSYVLRDVFIFYRFIVLDVIFNILRAFFYQVMLSSFS